MMPNINPKSSVSSAPTAALPELRSRPFQKRLNHLLTCGVFNARNVGVSLGTRALKNYVEERLAAFLSQTRSTRELTTKITYKALRNQARISDGAISRKREKEDAVARLRFLPSTEHPVEIKDASGVVLAYRFRIPLELLDTLEQSSNLLRRVPTSESSREGGGFVVRHYALWANSAGEVHFSPDYEKGKPLADEWLKANQSLFSYLADFLRIYNPEMYISMVNSVSKATSGKLSGLASPWHSVAIRQGAGSDGGPDQQNWDNEPSVFNTIIPFGAGGWEGGEIALWQLGYKVEVGRGDCFMFKGAIITHRTFPVTRGRRNFVDLFCYESIYEAARIQEENLGLPKMVDKRKVRAEERFQERRREVAENRKARSAKRNELRQQMHAQRPKDGVD